MNLIKSNKRIKVLEIFGGIGSPRKALENLGYDIKSTDYIEVLDYATIAYNRLFKNKYSPQDVRKWTTQIDLLVHGSPCQDWSNAGKKNIESGRSLLFLETIRIIEKELVHKSKYIVWENVKGLLQKCKHKYGYCFACDDFKGILDQKDFSCYENDVNCQEYINKIIVNNEKRRKELLEINDLIIKRDNLKDYLDNSELDENSNIININEIKNKITILGNKINHLNKNLTSEKKACHWYFFNYYLWKLEKIGYTNTYKILNAKKFGIPQNRERVFVVSLHKSTNKNFNWNNVQENKMTPLSYYLEQGQSWKKEFRYKEFTNFYTISRAKDNELVNGSYNRIWKINSYVGIINVTNPIKIGYVDSQNILHYRDLTEQECKINGL